MNASQSPSVREEASAVATRNADLAGRMTLFKLTWPILIDTALRILFMNVDVFMLSYYSENAVAAMGVITQVMFFLIILFFVVASGAGVLISQKLGAGDHEGAGVTAMASLNLTFVVGLVLSVASFFLSDAFVALFGLSPDIAVHAETYLFIFGLFALSQAFNIALVQICRSYGYARFPTIVGVGSNLLNVLGNYIALFGPFGLPVYGVAGVALSTVLSRLAGTVVLAIYLYRKKELGIPFHRFRHLGYAPHRALLAIGLPMSIMILSFNMSQMVTVYFVGKMGAVTLATYVILFNFTRFIFIIPMSIGQAAQILTGYRVGGGKFEEARLASLRYALYGLGASVFLASLCVYFRYDLLGIFSDNPEILRLGGGVIFVLFFTEAFRPLNMIIANSLKGAGDVRFSEFVGAVCIWVFSAGLSWLLGLHWGWGLYGVWLAFLADEAVRGVIMLWRWWSGAWQKHNLLACPAAAPAKSGNE